MARYYSKNYKRRINGKLKSWGGGGKWAIPQNTPYSQRKPLVRTPWGYWVESRKNYDLAWRKL